MKPIFSRLAPSMLLILLLAGCDLPGGAGTTPDAGTVSTIVASTLVALTRSAVQTPLASPTSFSSPTLGLPTNTASPTQTLTLTPTPTLTITAGPSPTITLTLKPTNTNAPTKTPIPDPGSIAGNILGYPYGSLPGLSIVAYGQEPPYNYSYVITGAGTAYYSLSGSYLIPGHYQVVAYDSSGNSGGCSTLVLVVSNQTVNCDINNWGGGYRAKPAAVPNP
jgi:hypothetical protein